MNHKIITTWQGGMQLHSKNPGGEFLIDAATEQGGTDNGLRPKALMLSALAGCSGLDIASLIKKMRIEVDGFHIETIGYLTEEEPAVYDKVEVIYTFVGDQLQEEKLKKIVDLSVNKYCGVIAMFRKFATVETTILFEKKSN